MAHLSLSQRQQIEAGIAEGKSNAQIAGEIGVHRATVGREIKRNAISRSHYEADKAQQLSKITQRMAVSLRNFEGHGRRFGFSQERKEGSVKSQADFFQLDTYIQSNDLVLIPGFSRATWDRNRYTVDDRVPSYSPFSIQDTFSFDLSTFNFDSTFYDYGNFSSAILPAENLNFQTHSNLSSESTNYKTYDHRSAASGPQHFSNSQRLSSQISQEIFISVEKTFSFLVTGVHKIKVTSTQQESNGKTNRSFEGLYLKKTNRSFERLSLKKRIAAPKRKIFRDTLAHFSSADILSFTFSEK